MCSQLAPGFFLKGSLRRLGLDECIRAEISREKQTANSLDYVKAKGTKIHLILHMHSRRTFEPLRR